MNEATHGIEIQIPKIKHPEIQKYFESRAGQLELSVWDFAGQHDYYNSHHYFLSTRSVFMVLWKMNEGEKGLEGLRFWFKSLSVHLSGEKQEGKLFSILVVGTFLDHPSVVQGIVAQTLREKQVQEIAAESGLGKEELKYLEVSCATLKNVELVRESILKEVFSHSYMGERVPKSYFAIQQFLKEMKEKLEKEKAAFPMIELTELVAKFGDADLVKRALKLLSLWGDCIYFDYPAELANIVILDPRFLTKDVLAQFFKPDMIQFFKDGILEHSNLELILPRFPKNLYPTIISLLEKFEVCFPRNRYEFGYAPTLEEFQKDSSIIPSYLPEVPPADFYENIWPNQPRSGVVEINRILIFNVIPKELISRLLVRLRTAIYEVSIWRFGIFLVYKQQQALVEIENTDILESESSSRLSLSTSASQESWFKQEKVGNIKETEPAKVAKRETRRPTDRLTITVRGTNDQKLFRNELMEKLVQEILGCSKTYSGLAVTQNISSPFDKNTLVKLDDLVAENLKPKDERTIVCPKTMQPLEVDELLNSAGFIASKPSNHSFSSFFLIHHPIN